MSSARHKKQGRMPFCYLLWFVYILLFFVFFYFLSLSNLLMPSLSSSAGQRNVLFYVCPAPRKCHRLLFFAYFSLPGFPLPFVLALLSGSILICGTKAYISCHYKDVCPRVCVCQEDGGRKEGQEEANERECKAEKPRIIFHLQENVLAHGWFLFLTK